MATARLKVKGMTCDHCVGAVKRALERVEGVRSADVDLQAQKATVEYDDSRVAPRELVGTVMDEGYTAEEAV